MSTYYASRLTAVRDEQSKALRALRDLSEQVEARVAEVEDDRDLLPQMRAFSGDSPIPTLR